MNVSTVLSRSLAFAGVSFLSIGIAHAQYFDYTTLFSPNPVTTTQAGNMITVTNDLNNAGSFAGSFGTDIVLANFAATATSATTGSWSESVTEAVTLTPSNSLGTPLAGDSPVTHTFTLNYSGELNNAAVTSTMTTLPTADMLYSFADGSNFTLHLTSYTGPSAPDGTGSGSLGGHVTGALGGVQQSTPEPGSMALLVGMATTGTGFIARRRRSLRKVA